jgi:predicted lipid-binding transport protein (Tim44 family)
MPSVPPQGQHDTRSNQYYGDVDNKEKDKKKDEKKSGGYGGALGGAAAGLVVGGIGGALIADAFGKCSKLDGYLILSLLIL